MNKKTLAGLLIIILAGSVGGYYVSTRQVVPQQKTPVQKIDLVRVPFDLDFSGEIRNVDNKPSFKNQNTRDVVSFELVSDQARNWTADLYLNELNVGRIAAQGISSIGFSPDDHYFAFLSRTVCGATCQRTEIDVINLSNKEIFPVKTPRTEKEHVGKKTQLGYTVFPFIGSYSWNPPNTLKITFFFVGVEGGDKMFRVSPKEIWQYNLLTKQYTLLETLPE